MRRFCDIRSKELGMIAKMSRAGALDYLRKEFGLTVKIREGLSEDNRLVDIADQLYKRARDEQSTTHGASSVKPTLIARLGYSFDDIGYARTRAHKALHRRYAEAIASDPHTPYTFLREELLMRENPNRILNVHEAELHGIKAKFTYGDEQRGIRFHDDPLELLALLGILRPRTLVLPERQRLQSSIPSRDVPLYETATIPLLEKIFHYRSTGVRQPGGKDHGARIDITSRAVFTFLESQWGFRHDALGVYRLNNIQDTPLYQTKRKLCDEHLDVYAAGLLASAAHVRTKEGCRNWLRFIDEQDRFSSELQQVISKLDQRWPTGPLLPAGNQNGYYRLSADDLSMLGAAALLQISVPHQGYLLNPAHIQANEHNTRRD
jgi:hypothetical protein